MIRRRSKPRNNHYHNGGRLTIGVVIPVFARTEGDVVRLMEALNKLSQQTRQPDYLILVDDGSPLAIPSIIRCVIGILRSTQTPEYMRQVPLSLVPAATAALEDGGMRTTALALRRGALLRSRRRHMLLQLVSCCYCSSNERVSCRMSPEMPLTVKKIHIENLCLSSASVENSGFHIETANTFKHKVVALQRSSPCSSPQFAGPKTSLPVCSGNCLIVVRLDVNSGPAVARNAGIWAAKRLGVRLVCFTDADCQPEVSHALECPAIPGRRPFRPAPAKLTSPMLCRHTPSDRTRLSDDKF